MAFVLAYFATFLLLVLMLFSSTTAQCANKDCGLNSYCKVGENQQPACLCPTGYAKIDPTGATEGCKQKFEAQSCDEESRDSDSFTFDRLENWNFPSNDYANSTQVDEASCRNECLRDCYCAAAVYNSDKRCWKKTSAFSDGIPDNTKTWTISLIKVRNKTNGNPGGNCSRKKGNSTLLLIISVLLGSSVLLNVLLLLGPLCVRFFFKQKDNPRIQQNQDMEMNLRTFTYQELDRATNGFSEQLGSGAFGTVYKGFLTFANQERKLVAVKKLDRMVGDGTHEQEFKAEVRAIGRTNHKNLVKLIGFCNEDQHRLLVYEFMGNGSVAGLLFGPSRPNWHQRANIAMETARGLLYLHEECCAQIVHCDIKPQNILLDDSFTAKISDFGLAKILKANQTRTAGGPRGTRGYVAPEWFRNTPITAKVDIYSYGIFLLELICRRKSLEEEAEDEYQVILADWSYDCYKHKKLDLLVRNDNKAMDDMERVKRYVMIAIWCIQEDPSLRPTMKKVCQMLEGTIEVPIPPHPYQFASYS